MQPGSLGLAAQCKNIISPMYLGSADPCFSSHNIISPNWLGLADHEE
jgi:hypothetical protein